MKAPSLLVVCGLVLCSTLLMRATTAELSSPTPSPHAATASTHPAFDCGGEPCDAVQRGLRAFLDRTPRWSGRKRARVRRLPHADGQLPALAGERRGEISSSCSGGATGIAEADDPLFRPIDADDFRDQRRRRQRFQQSSPERSRQDHASRCRRTSGSSIPRPTPCRTRRSSTCGAWCRASTTSR